MSSLTVRRAYVWLALLLLVVFVALVVQMGLDTPESVVLVVDTTDSRVSVPDRGVSDNREFLPRDYSGRRTHRRQPSTATSFDVEQRRPSPPVAMRQPLTIELNEADSITLQLLYGIGPTFARRIVNYREQLGGYVAPQQLLEVYGFDSSRYLPLVEHLAVDTSRIRRIDINTVSVKQLARHPYVDPWMARDIVRWRQQGHPFCSADDLRMVAGMDEPTLQRLLPYIEF